MKNLFMFSGQGSHYYQMGRALYRQNSIYRRAMRRMGAHAADLIGAPLLDIIFDEAKSKTDLFDRTLFTSPAILMAELALLEVLREADIQPDVVLGASLGSFAAAVAADAITEAEALDAVIAQARTLESRCKRGAMIAVLADHALYEREELRTNCELAATNFAGHFVISLPHERVSEVESYLRSVGQHFQQLPVAFAFHSQWIDAVRADTELLTSERPLSVPLACCAHADLLQKLPADYFWKVVRWPIRFDTLISRLEASDVYRYVDVGPAGTLATFLKYSLSTRSRSQTHRIMSPLGGELNALDHLLHACGRRPEAIP